MCKMRVLAIDTALEACAAAVLDHERGVLAHESKPMQRGHAEALMPLVRRAMDRSGFGFDDLHRIAVTIGPGSFTGLRVGIAAARGLALASGKQAVGLTTLSVFAAPLIAEDDVTPVVAAIDARHEHVYLQVFGAGGRILVPPRIAPLREALRACSTGRAPRLVGNAANLLAANWRSGEQPPVLVDQRSAPEIEWVARLGAAAPEHSGPPRPLYLRPPDAQRQDAAQIARR
jgi:tRNA threonylcarbamoyladenosine biosynthesis protein TsaB